MHLARTENEIVEKEICGWDFGDFSKGARQLSSEEWGLIAHLDH